MNTARTRIFSHFKPCYRWLDFSSTKGEKSRQGQSCDLDCCGDSIPKNKDVVVEKDCEPCSFLTWKPRIPELAPEVPTVKCPPVKFKPKICYAGMQPPPCPGDFTKKGKECLEKYCPHIIPKLGEAVQGPQKASSTCGTQPKRPKPKLPIPDWDHDCTMDNY